MKTEGLDVTDEINALNEDGGGDDAPDPAEKAIDDATPPIAEPDDTIEQAEIELPVIEGDTPDE